MAKYRTCVECGDVLSMMQDNMNESICLTCVLKKEDPDVIRPLRLRIKKKVRLGNG